MKKYLLLLALALPVQPARADLWGADLPLLVQIVANTLSTLHELFKQTSLMSDELEGIKDRIQRVQTIAEIVQPSQWDQWKDPREALSRIQRIYYTLPPEYRSEKTDSIEFELSRAMNLVGRLQPEIATSFHSGKELERRGLETSPGVAQKLTASGVGTLVALESQSQALQSQMVSLLSQGLAQANENEARSIVSRGQTFKAVSENLGKEDGRFSSHVKPMRVWP
jgi:hypothetical protein